VAQAINRRRCLNTRWQSLNRWLGTKGTDQAVKEIRRLFAGCQRTPPHARSSKEASTGHKEDFLAVIRRMGQQTENN
jgi:hypothetical protein